MQGNLCVCVCVCEREREREREREWLDNTQLFPLYLDSCESKKELRGIEDNGRSNRDFQDYLIQLPPFTDEELRFRKEEIQRRFPISQQCNLLA